MVPVYLILLLICVNDVFGENKTLCSLEDEACLTEASKVLHNNIVAGIPGKVETSDPMYTNDLNVDISDSKFNISKLKLIGLANCFVNDTTINSQESTFMYYLICPSLTVNLDLKADGSIEKTTFKGTGKGTIVYGTYHIIFRSFYTKYFVAGDLHFQAAKFKLDYRPESVKSDFTGISFDNNGVSAKENYDKLEKMIREPLIYNLMQKYLDNANAFQKIFAVKDIFVEL